jgi:NTP pyrophosphatase (non-canonical NTP hydrolase)
VDKEILLITQEECAEVSQAISKIFRFGLHQSHPITRILNKKHLEEEVGDLLCMINLLFEFEILSKAECEKAKTNKLAKLKKWSSIFTDSIDSE